MNGKSLTFGQMWGIPLRIHINWFLIAVIVTWSLAVGYFPKEHPGWETKVYWLFGAVTSLLFFGSVLFHELGHALVAQHEGVPVNSITLFIFGGIAHIAHEPETAGSEFRIVAAGPLASFSLAVFFHFLARALYFSPEVSSAAVYLSQINLLLAAFNLLPGFPLDGGRILRSIFWKWKNDFVYATRCATRTGFIVAILFVISGALLMLWGNYFNGLWVAFLGWYLSTTSWSSYRQADAEESESVRGSPEMVKPAIAPESGSLSVPFLNASKLEAPVGVFSRTIPIPGSAEPAEKSPFISTRSKIVSQDGEPVYSLERK